MTPLEVWDARIHGVPLYQTPRGSMAGALAGLARTLRDSSARRESGAAIAVPDFARVVLTGGGAAGLWPAGDVAFDHRAHCARAGAATFRQRLGERTLVLDLGQSGVKGWTSTRESAQTRDFEAVPVVAGRWEPQARAALVAAVASLAETLEGRGPAEARALVLALPCEVSDSGTLGSCSYPWDDGDPRLVGELAAAIGRRTGRAPEPLFFLNDAELAALGLLFREPDCEDTLVLTVGFGIGAAHVAGAR